MMPPLFSVGHHEAWTEVQSRLRPGAVLFAFMDDIQCRVLFGASRSGAHSVGERSLGVCPHPGLRREDKTLESSGRETRSM